MSKRIHVMFHFKIVSNAFVDDQGVVISFLIIGWRVRVARFEASNVGGQRGGSGPWTPGTPYRMAPGGREEPF